MQTITNNGKWVSVQIMTTGKWIELLEKEKIKWIEDGGNHFVKVTPDLCIGVKNYLVSDPYTPEEISQILLPLGLEFEMYRKEFGVSQVTEFSELETLRLAGYADPGTGIDYAYYYRTSGFVFKSTSSGVFSEDTSLEPFLEKDVRKMAQKIVQRNNRWIKSNLPSLARAVDLSAEDALSLYNRSSDSDVEVVVVELGGTAAIPWQSGSYFGSGGAWGVWSVYGQVTEKPGKQNDNGFCLSGSRFVSFDQGPAVVYTAAGDKIGRHGRVFYKTMYVVLPDKELKARAQKSE